MLQRNLIGRSFLSRKASLILIHTNARHVKTVKALARIDVAFIFKRVLCRMAR